MYDLKQAPWSCLLVVKPFKFHKKKKFQQKRRPQNMTLSLENCMIHFPGLAAEN